jgi:hypothetical protein
LDFKGAALTGIKTISEEFFMPLGGATFDENSVPPWTRGDFRGF